MKQQSYRSLLTVVILLSAIAGLTYLLYHNSHQLGYRAKVQNLTEKIAQSVLLSCRRTDESLQRRTSAILEEVDRTLSSAGTVSETEDKFEWTVLDPFTDAEVRYQLPRLRAGKMWLTPRNPGDPPMALTRELVSKIHGTVTIYQRVNARGDFLAVSTTSEPNHPSLFPAYDPDGIPNRTVHSLLRGIPFQRPELVNRGLHWTVYHPLFNEDQTVIGAVGVRVREPMLERLRREVMETPVGKTGYVYVLQGSGPARGTYVISKAGLRDGENLWESIDVAGRPFIQKIVRRAVNLQGGKSAIAVPSASERYPWINPGERSARFKSVAIVYFEPWDWVIGAGYYEDEF